MPIHDTKRVEYTIDNGHINIVADDGFSVPAYWAHPRIGRRFSAICLLHDWWGTNDVIRLLANFFAQMGYYVIAPDMFQGMTTSSPAEAMRLLEETREIRYKAVDVALSVLETHHLTNRSVAAIGLGMGGTLCFEAAIKRDDLEAAIAYGGFPQQYLGQFAQANTPILAIYGSEEPYTKPAVIQSLADELAQTALADKHKVIRITGAKHEFFSDVPDENMRKIGKLAINHTVAFLEEFLVETKP